MKTVFGVALFAAGAIAAAGCASSDDVKASRERNPAPCPNIVVLEDAARLVEFNGEAALENVAWTAEVMDVNLTCRYFADKPIEASVDVKLAFGKGPAATGASKDYSYFVAVTRTDREVIAKETFTLPIEFDGDDATRLVEERVKEIFIPRKGEQTSGTNFEVVVGLVLTRDQAVYNRSGKSLKFPELE